jgi:hypothetical protein
VELHHLKAGGKRAPGRSGERLREACDFGAREFRRRRIARLEGQRAGRRRVLALRPAWASWIAATAPCCRTKAAMRARNAM